MSASAGARARSALHGARAPEATGAATGLPAAAGDRERERDEDTAPPERGDRDREAPTLGGGSAAAQASGRERDREQELWERERVLRERERELQTREDRMAAAWATRREAEALALGGASGRADVGLLRREREREAGAAEAERYGDAPERELRNTQTATFARRGFRASFDGLPTSNARAFLLTFERAARLGRWSNDERVLEFLQALTAGALDWVALQPEETLDEWQRLRDKFAAHFGVLELAPTAPVARPAAQRLRRLQQQPTQSVVHYSTVFMQLCEAAKVDVQSEAARAWWLEGLQPRLQPAVLACPAQTLSALIKFAAELEVLQTNATMYAVGAPWRGAYASAPTPAGGSPAPGAASAAGQPISAATAARAATRGPPARMPGDGTAARPPESGPRAGLTPSAYLNTGTYCDYCQRPGHDISVCRTRARALGLTLGAGGSAPGGARGPMSTAAGPRATTATPGAGATATARFSTAPQRFSPAGANAGRGVAAVEVTMEPAQPEATNDNRYESGRGTPAGGPPALERARASDRNNPVPTGARAIAESVRDRFGFFRTPVVVRAAGDDGRPLLGEGHAAQACLDTGAAVSLVDKRWVEERADFEVNGSADVPALRAANGSRLVTYGRATLHVQLTDSGGQTQRHKVDAIVAKLDAHFDIILGMNVLRALDVRLEPASGRLFCGEPPSQTARVRPAVTAAVVSMDAAAAAVDAAARQSGARADEGEPAELVIALVDVAATDERRALQDVWSEERDDYFWPTQAKQGSVRVNGMPTPGAGTAGNVSTWTREPLNSGQQPACTHAQPQADTETPPTAGGKEDDMDPRLQQLLQEFEDVFQPPEKWSPGGTTIARHRIDTGDSPPVVAPLHRHAPRIETLIEEEVSQMLAQNVIEPSQSEWRAPVVLVRKKDGTMRFCVDYRRLNAVTKRNQYPMPDAGALLAQLGEAQVFSTLDLASGYWQVELEPGDRDKTAFATRSGLYRFNVMPFGLVGAPATFQRVMRQALASVGEERCCVYLDDVLVFSPNMEQHLGDLRRVLQALRAARLVAKRSKCNFGRSELKFLGHIVGARTVRTDPAKITAMLSIPSPCNIHQLRVFLGVTGYYRRFILNYSLLAEPLTALLRADTPFRWGPRQQQAFEELRRRLTSAPVLAQPDWQKPFVLATDASNVAIGAVLSQPGTATREIETATGELTVTSDVEKPVAFASRQLNSAEKNYSATERECLAVVWGLQHFRRFVLGSRVIVYSDHEALRWLLAVREPTSRLARWVWQLNEFDIEIRHRPGRAMAPADALSRLAVGDSAPVGAVDAGETAARDAIDWRGATLSDGRWAPVARYLQGQALPQEAAEAADVLAWTTKKLLSWDNETGALVMHGLSRKLDALPTTRLVVPTALVARVLQLHHDSALGGHFGFDKTLAEVAARYYWPEMLKDVRSYVRSCEACARRKQSTAHAPGRLQSIVAEEPFELISVDVLGPLTPSATGNRYIVVVSDHFTKWTEATAMPAATARAVAHYLVNDIFCRFGAPSRLLSDQGSIFTGSLLAEVCKLFDVKKIRTTAYHPQTDGLTERFNKTLAAGLSILVQEQPTAWDTVLQPFMYAYRASVQKSTTWSPYFLLFGREPRFPSDVALQRAIETRERPWPRDIQEWVIRQQQLLRRARQDARDALNKAREQQKRYYDSQHANFSFDEGDLVMVYNPSNVTGLSDKLQAHWRGPYRVVEKPGQQVRVVINVGDGTILGPVHVQRLRPFVARPRLLVDSRLDVSDPGPAPAAAPEIENGNKANANGQEQVVQELEAFEARPAPAAAAARLQQHELEPDVFTVEEILAVRDARFRVRQRNGRVRYRPEKQYLIKWLGYTADQNSWVWDHDILDRHLIAVFEGQHETPRDEAPSGRGAV